VNLLKILYHFKDTKERLESDHLLTDCVTYYDYMSSLVSIYLDVSLELKFRFKKFNLKEYKHKYFKQTICLNFFYLLGELNLFVNLVLIYRKL
jgi:hypothetical protein